ncbi:hypothetical protein Q7P37_009919 [Cladosporium fusiforme]
MEGGPSLAIRHPWLTLVADEALESKDISKTAATGGGDLDMSYNLRSTKGMVSSCHALKPSALQKSDEPTWQSGKRSSLDDAYPSAMPDMVDVAANLAARSSAELCTTRHSLYARQVSWLHAPTAASTAHADNADTIRRLSIRRPKNVAMCSSSSSGKVSLKELTHRHM